MKKIINCLLVVVIALSFVTVPVNAYQVGDRVGKVTYTDISAYINHYPIVSYTYDGGTVVYADDLVNYGFNVVYNDAARSLNITPDKSQTTLRRWRVFKNADFVMQRWDYAVYSDINVYLNGVWIPSCATQFGVLVKLEDLASEAIGTSFTWDGSTRSAKLWLDWANIIEYAPLEEGDNEAYADGVSGTILVTMYRLENQLGVTTTLTELNPEYFVLEGNGQTFVLPTFGSEEKITLGEGAPPQYGANYFISPENAIKLIKQKYGVDVVHTLTGNTYFWFEGGGYEFIVERWYETDDIDTAIYGGRKK